MAIYSNHIKTISRSNGQSAVAAAAYRSCDNLKQFQTGIVNDFTRKEGLLYEQIVTPQNIQTPDWVQDRERLWNQAETADTRKNATLARELMLALPHELSDSERAALATEYAQWVADRHQVVCDVVIHAPDKDGDERNYHLHLMMTTRQITEDGFKSKKNQTLNGETVRFIAFDYGGKRGSAETELFRETAADMINNALEKAGETERVDHRSYADQGSAKLPTVHLGKDTNKLKQRGNTEGLRLVAINEERTLHNQVYDALNTHHTLTEHLHTLPANDNHYLLPEPADPAPEDPPAVTVAATPEPTRSLETLQAERAALQQQIARITAHSPARTLENTSQEPQEAPQSDFLHQVVHRVVSVAHWVREHATELYQRFAEQEEEEQDALTPEESPTDPPWQGLDEQEEWQQHVNSEQEQSL